MLRGTFKMIKNKNKNMFSTSVPKESVPRAFQITLDAELNKLLNKYL